MGVIVVVKLKVDGMSCQHCKATVEGALKDVPGVTDVDISLEDGFAVVRGSNAVERLLKAIEEAGYTAELAEAENA